VTPDELDAVLSDRPDLNPFECDLVAALREAWAVNADVITWGSRLSHEKAGVEVDLNAARAEVERLTGIITQASGDKGFDNHVRLLYDPDGLDILMEHNPHVRAEVERLHTEPMKAHESRLSDENVRLRRERNDALAAIDRVRALRDQCAKPNNRERRTYYGDVAEQIARALDGEEKS
jgi:hypothetical protein